MVCPLRHGRGCVDGSKTISLHTGIGLALMQGVLWSMAEELPGKLNMEVGFSTCAKGKFFEFVNSKWCTLMVEYDSSLC